MSKQDKTTDNFYRSTDRPTSAERELMWSTIEWNVQQNTQRKASVVHWKSFWIGSAAAILMILASVGTISIWQSWQQYQHLGNNRLDIAYEQAMNRFESLTPALIRQASQQERNQMESTMNNIRDIDEMIQEIRTDMRVNGATSTKRKQLKRLYALKMDYVKELILNEQVSL